MLFKAARLTLVISVLFATWALPPAFCETWVLKEDFVTAREEPDTLHQFFYNDNCNRIREETDYRNNGETNILSKILYNDRQ